MWQPIYGLYCVWNPVEGCIFALEGGAFGANGLVLVSFGDESARCAELVDRSGFVQWDTFTPPANSRPSTPT